MKCTAKITSKGQITLPTEVRRELGVREGDTVLFEKEGDVIRVLPKRMGPIPFAAYAGIGTPDLPADTDIVQYVREMRGHDPDEDEWERADELAQSKPALKRACPQSTPTS
jgi:AbrB family looped-hinge helix DNA binding protein